MGKLKTQIPLWFAIKDKWGDASKILGVMCTCHPGNFLQLPLESNQLYAIYRMFLKLTKGAVSTARKSEQNSVNSHVEKFIIKISGTSNQRRKKYIKNYLKCWKAVFQQSNCWIHITYTLNGCKITWFVMFSSSNDRSFYNCCHYCLAHKIKHLYVEKKVSSCSTF